MEKEKITIEDSQKVWDAVRECYVCDKEREEAWWAWFNARSTFYKEKTPKNEEKLKELKKLMDNAHKNYKIASETMDLVLKELVQISDNEF